MVQPGGRFHGCRWTLVVAPLHRRDALRQRRSGAATVGRGPHRQPQGHVGGHRIETGLVATSPRVAVPGYLLAIDLGCQPGVAIRGLVVVAVLGCAVDQHLAQGLVALEIGIEGGQQLLHGHPAFLEDEGIQRR